jgi:hypothetical protein
LDRAFAIERFAESIDYAAEQGTTDGHLQQTSGGFHFVTGFDLVTGTEKHATDFGFF